MNRLINIIGTIVLLGILVKLSYVFICLFDELDADIVNKIPGGEYISKITGITFAFASVYFVTMVNKTWLKLTMVTLDVMTILYFYLHTQLAFPIEYSSVIVSAYSGIIIFYLGKTVNEQIRSVTQSDTLRIRELEERLRSVTETQEYENERKRITRRMNEAKNDSTRKKYEQELLDLNEKYKHLNISQYEK